MFYVSNNVLHFKNFYLNNFVISKFLSWDKSLRILVRLQIRLLKYELIRSNLKNIYFVEFIIWVIIILLFVIFVFDWSQHLTFDYIAIKTYS